MQTARRWPAERRAAGLLGRPLGTGLLALGILITGTLATGLWGAGPGAPATALAQTPFAQDPDDRHGIFLDTLDVHIVNIEVVVTDEQGVPVTGLERDDFELRVDGEPVEIANFLAVRDGQRIETESEAGSGPGSPLSPTYEASRAATRADAEQRYVVLFIDNGNIAPHHRKRIFDQLRDHVDQLLEPVDRVMVVVQDGEIRVEQPFTSSAELVLAALDRLEATGGRGRMFAAQRSIVQRQIEQGQNPPGSDNLGTGGTVAPPEPDPEAGGLGGIPSEPPTYQADARSTWADVSQYALTLRAEAHRTLSTLSRFVSSLAGLPGRKAVVYVSDGLELMPGEYLFRLWEAKYRTIASREVGISNVDTEMNRYRLDHELDELVSRANANRIAFYTIQGGTGDFGNISAETSSAVVDSLARTADGDREESLRALAHDTGGIPLLGGSGVDHLLGQLQRDFSHYYSLGYLAESRGDGRYHRISVRVRDETAPGGQLRTRFLEGYRDKSVEDRMTDQTLASLLHDVGHNPLDIQVELGKESRVKGQDTFVVPVMVKIPMSKLVLLPQKDVHLGHVSIYIAVGGPKGSLSDPQRIDVPVRIPNEKLLQAMGGTAGYAARLEMRKGPQKLAIGVRDELAAVGSTLNLNVQVGDS